MLNERQENAQDEKKKVKILQKMQQVDLKEKCELIEFVLGKTDDENKRLKREEFANEFLGMELEDFHALLINKEHEL